MNIRIKFTLLHFLFLKGVSGSEIEPVYLRQNSKGIKEKLLKIAIYRSDET